MRAHQLLMKVVRLFTKCFGQFHVPTSLDIFGDIVFETSMSSRFLNNLHKKLQYEFSNTDLSHTVRKDEAEVVLDLVNQIHSFLVRFFRFATKSSNKIARQEYICRQNDV
jgi:hypothetical protein